MFEHDSHVDAGEELAAAGRVFELVTKSGPEGGGARATDGFAEDLNDSRRCRSELN
jgi:hypothetical protein